MCCMENGLQKETKCVESRGLLQKSRGKITVARSRMVSAEIGEIVRN